MLVSLFHCHYGCLISVAGGLSRDPWGLLVLCQASERGMVCVESLCSDVAPGSEIKAAKH